MKDQNKPLPTQGEWVVRYGMIMPKHTLDGAEIAKMVEYEGELYQCRTDAQAICTAINNTYGKGINPEAVSELLEALEWIKYHSTLDNFDLSEIQRVAKEAIKKAEL